MLLHPQSTNILIFFCLNKKLFPTLTSVASPRMCYACKNWECKNSVSLRSTRPPKHCCAPLPICPIKMIFVVSVQNFCQLKPLDHSISNYTGSNCATWNIVLWCKRINVHCISRMVVAIIFNCNQILVPSNFPQSSDVTLSLKCLAMPQTSILACQIQCVMFLVRYLDYCQLLRSSQHTQWEFYIVTGRGTGKFF